MPRGRTTSWNVNAVPTAALRLSARNPVYLKIAERREIGGDPRDQRKQRAPGRVANLFDLARDRTVDGDRGDQGPDDAPVPPGIEEERCRNELERHQRATAQAPQSGAARQYRRKEEENECVAAEDHGSRWIKEWPPISGDSITRTRTQFGSGRSDGQSLMRDLPCSPEVPHPRAAVKSHSSGFVSRRGKVVAAPS